MSVLTLEAASRRMVGRQCGWRSYVHSPRGPRKISTLHSPGHLPTMEDRSTLRKRCSGISLFFEVLRDLATSYNSYMVTIHKKLPCTVHYRTSVWLRRALRSSGCSVTPQFWVHVQCSNNPTNLYFILSFSCTWCWPAYYSAFPACYASYSAKVGGCSSC